MELTQRCWPFDRRDLGLGFAAVVQLPAVEAGVQRWRQIASVAVLVEELGELAVELDGVVPLGLVREIGVAF